VRELAFPAHALYYSAQARCRTRPHAQTRTCPSRVAVSTYRTRKAAALEAVAALSS
jgi:hypothetical protein